MSRQRAWQIKAHKENRCITCGKLRNNNKQRCNLCRKKARIITRQWVKDHPGYVKKHNDKFRKKNPNYNKNYYRDNIKGKK